MPENHWNAEIFEVVKAEHEELAELLDAIRGALSSAERERNQIEGLVERLSTAVALHFEHEESGGYLQEALDRAPRFTGQADSLRLQHDGLREEIEKLRMLLHSGVESAAWWTRIDSDFQRFASQLLQHEHAENQLLQQAFTDDIGTGD